MKKLHPLAPASGGHQAQVKSTIKFVIPAQAGIHNSLKYWIPYRASLVRNDEIVITKQSPGRETHYNQNKRLKAAANQ